MTFNSDESDLFRNAMEDVTPLKDCSSILWLKSPAAGSPRGQQWEQQLDNPLTVGHLDILPVAEPLTFRAEGIQTGVLDKLRQGKYPQQASLNLLRQPVEQCRQALYLFMRQAQQDNVRNFLIVHGKGRHDTSHANIVRSYLLRWLRQFDDVQAFCCAQPHHGGSGACYVALRKSDLARLDNRERHARHSR